VRFLLEKGANINAKSYGGLTPLHFAVYFKCREDIVKLLLEDENTERLMEDWQGRTPLVSVKQIISNITRHIVENPKLGQLNSGCDLEKMQIRKIAEGGRLYILSQKINNCNVLVLFLFVCWNFIWLEARFKKTIFGLLPLMMGTLTTSDCTSLLLRQL
jgi:ankyrin repeat protein